MTYTYSNVTELATTAAGLARKSTKKVLHDQLVKLATGELDGLQQRVVLAQLYAHFMPSAPAKPRTGPEWLTKALAGSRDVREYLQYMYSDGTALVATDGNVMLWIEGATYPQGYYDKAMNPVDITSRYPDYRRVIPDTSEGFTWHTLDNLTVKHSVLNGTPVVVLGREGFAPVTVNADCWARAMSGFKEPRIRIKDSLHTILIDEGQRHAVLMPARG
jgi:hypothetical protein